MAITMKEIKKLSIAEKIILAEKIWDSIPQNSDELSISSIDEKELENRINKLDSGNAKTVSWADLKKRLRDKRK